MDGANLAIGPHDPVIEVVGRALREDRPLCLGYARPVVGVDESLETLRRREEGLRHKATDAKDLIRPCQPVSIDVVFPAAQVSETLRLLQAALTRPQRRR